MLVGTVLVGFVSIAINITADALVTDSDERRSMDERRLATYEALHEESRVVRERLIRLTFRTTNDTVRCPFAGTDDAAVRCVEYVRTLRQAARQDLFALDWTAPLLFAQIEAQTRDSRRMGQAMEAALDVSTLVARDHQGTIDRLDARWADECDGGALLVGPCAEISACRHDYASAETYCTSFGACMVFDAEARLLKQITGQPQPYASDGCTSILERRAACASGAPVAEVVCAALPDEAPPDIPCVMRWKAHVERCESLSEVTTPYSEPIPAPEPLRRADAPRVVDPNPPRLPTKPGGSGTRVVE